MLNTVQVNLKIFISRCVFGVDHDSFCPKGRDTKCPKTVDQLSDTDLDQVQQTLVDFLRNRACFFDNADHIGFLASYSIGQWIKSTEAAHIKIRFPGSSLLEDMRRAAEQEAGFKGSYAHLKRSDAPNWRHSR